MSLSDMTAIDHKRVDSQDGVDTFSFLRSPRLHPFKNLCPKLLFAQVPACHGQGSEVMSQAASGVSKSGKRGAEAQPQTRGGQVRYDLKQF
jgi:hypothetical protein